MSEWIKGLYLRTAKYKYPISLLKVGFNINNEPVIIAPITMAAPYQSIQYFIRGINV